ncbi:general secretion pathway protein E [Prosthecobacter debontii]|uniref:General secretion pathway protein E n=1 Tax=Prosthecobacter debontii TaxID=48467 RepID=A0A1T4YG01_9BACT|nr:GspE/PulE family protein [Prosthecobacter debontii]SKB00704.1 general secretion pathway protein E [Prosthecobacter debontii]
MMPLIQKILAEAGCGDNPAVQQAVEEACYNQTSFVEAVLDCEGVRERDFLLVLARTLSLAWWEGGGDHPAEPGLRRYLPAEIALRHRLLPVGVQDKGDAEGKPVLHLATFDPLNLVTHQRVASSLNQAVVWHVGQRTRIVEGLQKLYGLGADTFEKILRGRADWGAEEIGDEVTVLDEPEDEEASVVRFVNQIIRRGLEQRATDIHVEPQQDRLRIRYRIDGRLEELPVPENIKSLQASVIARLKIMARLDIAEKRLPQDGRINLEMDGMPIDVRVATIPSVEGESISLRLLSQQAMTISRLGLTDTVKPVVDELLKLPNGIILITGPTGSGKSTTLYAFLSEMNQTHRRIVTIEDPVEYKMPGMVQIAVKPEIGLTFASGLRSILRGDPNVVMVGEMRDLETTEIAIRAALTGHLVFSTLHTNDAIGGITRLVDMGVEPFLVSSAVRAFLAQRLVRKLCPLCKAPAEVESDYLKSIGFPLNVSGQIMRAVGCEACRGSGYQGRLSIYEVVLMTQALQHLINTRAHPAELQKQACQDGYIPMRGYGFQKVLAGETTIEEVLSVTSAGRSFHETAPRLTQPLHLVAA